MGALEQQINLPLGPVKFEMSPQIGQLIEALAKAHKSFKPVVKDAVNPFFKSKYADLASVIDATKDGLSDNNLAVLQPPVYNRDGAVQIITLLAHSSGEWLKCILDIPVSKPDAQGIGSAITYGRRYALSAVLDVASEEDDDANAAVSGQFKKPGVRKEESPEEFDQRTEGERNISSAQHTELVQAIKRTGKTDDEVRAALSFIGEQRLEHVKANQFQKLLKWANAVGKTKGPAVAEQDRMKANKKLWATASEFSVPEEDVKRAAYETYKVTSMTELTAEQLIDHEKWVRSVAEEQTA